MKYLVTAIAAAAALGAVTLAPDNAEARRFYGGGWGVYGPGVGITVGPRYGYRDYGYYGRPYWGYGPRYSYGYGPRWRWRHNHW